MMDDEEIEIDNFDDEEEYGPIGLKPQESLMFLTMKEIYKRIEDKVNTVKNLLNFSFDDSLIILHYFSWNIEKIENEYFNDPEKYEKLSGLKSLNEKDSPKILNNRCSICLISNPNISNGLQCNHSLCSNCWRNYFISMISDYNSNCFWRCPFEGCSLIIKHTFILNELQTTELNDSYILKLCRLFAEENKSVKWCPFPGCIYCVENISMNKTEIKCLCNNVFCFKCSMESHKPCSCLEFEKWNQKALAESGNISWIQINTKPCPKCRNPIEKNNGCNHMTCRIPSCRHEYCWMCMGPWASHNNSTGGYYKCNKYEEMSEEDKKKMTNNIDKEKSVLEKYIFYSDRFNNNRIAENSAKQIFVKLQTIHENLHKLMKYNTGELQFLLDAGEFLITARKTLKYTYVFGYFLKSDKKDIKDKFEFDQAWFEEFCEKLHELLEMKTDDFFDEDKRDVFLKYKEKVIDITQATKKYMNKLLLSLEIGILGDKMPALD